MSLPANPFKALWHRLPQPLQNKYHLTLLVFAFILVFLDKNSLYKQWRLHRAVGQIEEEKAFYEQKIKEVRVESEDFEETKERFAREQYYMKRANEDVFVIRTKR
jgi:cell division protein DivIC